MAASFQNAKIMSNNNIIIIIMIPLLSRSHVYRLGRRDHNCTAADCNHYSDGDRIYSKAQEKEQSVDNSK